MAHLRLRVSRKARSDLVEIGRFTAVVWGLEQCRRYLMQLDARLRALARNPRLGTPSDDIKPGYLRYREGRHVIFYRQSPKTLDVVRVLHERMLPKRHL